MRIHPLFPLSILATPLLAGSVHLTKIGEYRTHVYNAGACEIPSYDVRSKRLFVINGATNKVDVVDLANPALPTYLFSVDLSAHGANPTSVATWRGLVAVSVGAATKTDPGKVVFFGADGTVYAAVTVGALPDMLCFTPDGARVLVAGEGEPSSDYAVDPLGTVSIIDVQKPPSLIAQAHVTTLDFSAFDNAVLDPSVRVFGPGASVAQDFEPEYVAVAPDSKTAWITLQENNAVARLDLVTKSFTAIQGLGFKDHLLAGNGIDASDKDSAIAIAGWPVKGMYLPDSIAAFRVGAQDYYVTANEGDAREWGPFVEEARVKALALDATAFPSAATLKLDANLGRLNVTKANGDADGDGDYDALYAFGARSITIRKADGSLVWDSGQQLEEICANAFPLDFNADHAANASFDTRSDNKGPEPEGLALGRVGGRWHAFVGLERIGGIAVFNLQDPAHPVFVEYVNPRDFAGDPALDTAGDLGPEGLQFVPAALSPNGKDLLIVGNEISGSTAIFQIDAQP
ncbi:MAG: alkaline phosphatase [Planctomycetota bacterium]|nr:MAG: alkaline phosphatase [Planctomycetota bacterium]